MSETIIRPIKNAEQYQQVIAQIDQLLDCPPNSPEADLLEVLSILADDYENKTTPILPPDPIDAIRYQADELGLSSKELAALLGGKNRLSEVLNLDTPPAKARGILDSTTNYCQSPQAHRRYALPPYS